MKEQKYTRPQATRLIPLLEGIAVEITERRKTIEMLEEMIASLKTGHSLHAREVSIRRLDLHREHVELKRIGTELDRLGCSLALIDPFEINIPGVEEDFAWRAGESFLRSTPIGPFAA